MRWIIGVMGYLVGVGCIAQPCVTLTGDAIQGGLLWGSVGPATVVRLDERDVPVASDGRFVVGLGRDAPSQLILEIEGNTVCRQTVTVTQRDYVVQHIEGVPQRTVTPPQEELDRIARERILVRDAKAARLERPDLLSAVKAGMRWPLLGPITGVYGSQRVYNGTPRSPHYGVDVAAPTGQPVRAPSPGVVTLAEPDLFYSGGTVILDHGYGLSSSFLHLSQVAVSVGQEVAVGDVIGAVGATGRATGPHLDWRMSWFDQRVDPQLLVPSMPPSDKSP